MPEQVSGFFVNIGLVNDGRIRINWDGPNKLPPNISIQEIRQISTLIYLYC